MLEGLKSAAKGSFIGIGQSDELLNLNTGVEAKVGANIGSIELVTYFGNEQSGLMTDIHVGIGNLVVVRRGRGNELG